MRDSSVFVRSSRHSITDRQQSRIDARRGVCTVRKAFTISSPIAALPSDNPDYADEAEIRPSKVALRVNSNKSIIVPVVKTIPGSKLRKQLNLVGAGWVASRSQHGQGIGLAGSGLSLAGSGIQLAGTGVNLAGGGLSLAGGGLKLAGSGLKLAGTGQSGSGLKLAGQGLKLTGTGKSTIVSGIIHTIIPAILKALHIKAKLKSITAVVKRTIGNARVFKIKQFTRVARGIVMTVFKIATDTEHQPWFTDLLSLLAHAILNYEQGNDDWHIHIRAFVHAIQIASHTGCLSYKS